MQPTTNDLVRDLEREWYRVKGQTIVCVQRAGRIVVHLHVKGSIFLEVRITRAKLRQVLEALRECPDRGAPYLQGGDDGSHN